MQEYIVKVCNNGYKAWYQNGKLHRIDGPAEELMNGYKAWYQNGKLHRLDGPAIEHIDNKYWYIEGVEYTETEFKKKTEKNCIENKVVEIEGKKYKLVPA